MNTLNRIRSKVNGRTSDTDDGSRAYTALRERVMERLDEGRHLTSEKIDEAINRAVSSATTASDMTKEQIARAAERVRRELTGARENVEERSEAVREKIVPPRPKTRFLVLASAAMGIGSFLFGRLSTTPRRSRTYQKGDEVEPGLLICDNCDTRLQIVSRTHLPACSNCRHTRFSKIG